MSFITRQGRTLLLAAVMVVGAVCVSYGDGGNPSELVGRWIYYEGADGVDDIELFSDGAGIIKREYYSTWGGTKYESSSITWKAENKRLRLMSPTIEAIAADYNVSGYELILVYDGRQSARFMRKEKFEEIKKAKAEAAAKEAEAAKQEEQLNEQGEAYYNKGMYDKAIEAYTEAIKINPKSLIGYVLRGQTYCKKKDYDRAIDDCTMGIEVAPNAESQAMAINGRGYAYLGKRDYDKALADFNKAVQLTPKKANPYDSRGEAYLIMGDYDKAIADYIQALRLDSTKGSAKKGLAEAQMKKNEKKFEKISSYFTDSRDGQKYRSVKIGGKTWMARNLNYQTGNSWCYGGDNSNCDKYGRLYDWNTAKTACPAGWHLPSREEWNGLVSASGDGKAGIALKSTSDWPVTVNDDVSSFSYGKIINGNGTDNSGFSALPGGNRQAGNFYNVGNFGYWWTATEGGSSKAYRRGMGGLGGAFGDRAREDKLDKNDGYSVRCVQD